MSNFLPPDTINTIITLARDGNSLRKIARRLGISKNTVAKYANGHFGFCKCGQPAGHQGWCRHRYMASEARQAYHAIRRGETITYVPPIPKSRSAASALEKREWLGLVRHNRTTLSKRLHIKAIGVVERNTKYVAHDVKDDVRQHMIVAVLDGALSMDDVPRAVKTFIGFYRNYIGQMHSIQEPVPGLINKTYEAVLSNERAQAMWQEYWDGLWTRMKRNTKRQQRLDLERLQNEAAGA